MRITISGAPDRTARHGLGAAVELRAPNARAADAFLEQLTAALASTEPAEDGHALVRMETRSRSRPQRQLGPRARVAVRIAYALPPYAVVLFLIGRFSPLDGGTAAASLTFGGVLGLVGGIPCGGSPAGALVVAAAEARGRRGRVR